MVDVERHAFGAAIDALPAELLKKVFAHLILKERALLILDPRDLRSLKLLRIELHQLRRDAAYRQVPAPSSSRTKGSFPRGCRREGGSHPLGLDAV